MELSSSDFCMFDELLQRGYARLVSLAFMTGYFPADVCQPCRQSFEAPDEASATGADVLGP